MMIIHVLMMYATPLSDAAPRPTIIPAMMAIVVRWEILARSVFAYPVRGHFLAMMAMSAPMTVAIA